MDWERIGRVVGRFLLFLLEYSFKFSAAVVAGIVLGSGGSFGAKLAAGFGSLSPVLRQIFETPERVREMAEVVHDYNTLTAATFNEQYGANAVNSVFNYLNEGILYFQAVYQNLANQPVTTVSATALAFFTLYLLGRVLRFARQKGQGSFFTRVERRLGERVFKSSANFQSPPATPNQSESKSVDREALRKKFHQSRI